MAGIETIQPGDTVIVSTGFARNADELTPIVISKGGDYQSVGGFFKHDDMIGKPYGSKIVSSSRTLKGHIYILKLTPELWTLSLPHRTQILYHADISMVVARLGLRPGCKVVESGTGSGSLTHALARAVGPTGHVYTFEFNAHRVSCAQAEFKAHGLARTVTCTHRDAVGGGFLPEAPVHGCDGVFLDLPNPWAAIRHGAAVLAKGGTLCSFSPCIEQITRTAAAMRELGFEDIRCFETLSRPVQVSDGRAPPERARLDITTVEQAQAVLAQARAQAAGLTGPAPKISKAGKEVWRPGAGKKPAGPTATATATAAALPGSPSVGPSEAAQPQDGQREETQQPMHAGSKRARPADAEEGAEGDDGRGSVASMLSAPDPDDPAAFMAGLVEGEGGSGSGVGGRAAPQEGTSSSSAVGASAASPTPVPAAPGLTPWPSALSADPGPVTVRYQKRTAGHTGYLLFGTLYKLPTAEQLAAAAAAASKSGEGAGSS